MPHMYTSLGQLINFVYVSQVGSMGNFKGFTDYDFIMRSKKDEAIVYEPEKYDSNS